MRRLRILMGGKIGDKISFFVETDSPNIGKKKILAIGAIGRKRTSEALVPIQSLLLKRGGHGG